MVSAARWEAGHQRSIFPTTYPTPNAIPANAAITIAAKTKTLSRGPVLDGTSSRRRGEVGEQVQRPRHQHRPRRARELACASRARRRGPSLRLRSREPSAPKRCKFVGGQARARSTTRSRRACRPTAESAASIPSASLSREDRGDDDVAPARARAAGASRRRRGCARRPRSRAASSAALEAARERQPLRRGRVDRPPEERLRRGDGEREVRAPGQDGRSAPDERRAPATPARRGRRWRRPGRPRASRAAISSRVSPS